MKIFSMFTKDGRVDVPLKDNQAGEAAQIMQNPEMSLMDKVREMTDLSNKLTKAQLHDLESKIEKVAFTDINGQTITLIKDPEFSDEQVWQIISDHAVEKGGPGSGPHAVGDSVRITGSNRHAGKTGKVLRHDPKFNSTIVDVGEYESATVHPNDLESTEKSTQKSLDVLRNSAGKLQKGGPGSGRHYEGGPKDKPASGYTPVEGQINHKEYPEKLKSKTDAELNFIIRDAHEAIKANPEGKKSGYYADEINYAGMELSRRAKDQSRNAIGKPQHVIPAHNSMGIDVKPSVDINHPSVMRHASTSGGKYTATMTDLGNGRANIEMRTNGKLQGQMTNHPHEEAHKLFEQHVRDSKKIDGIDMQEKKKS
jgi:hypothetical protein